MLHDNHPQCMQSRAVIDSLPLHVNIGALLRSPISGVRHAIRAVILECRRNVSLGLIQPA